MVTGETFWWRVHFTRCTHLFITCYGRNVEVLHCILLKIIMLSKQKRFEKSMASNFLSTKWNHEIKMRISLCVGNVGLASRTIVSDGTLVVEVEHEFVVGDGQHDVVTVELVDNTHADPFTIDTDAHRVVGSASGCFHLCAYSVNLKEAVQDL